MDNKSFYKKVFALVIPMALQNLINVGVTTSDVLMLGSVGEKVLSASSLAGQIYFIMTLIFFGLTSGASVLTAQYWGKQDRDTIERILGFGLKISMIVGITFTTVTFLIPGTLMKIFSSDGIVIAEGVKYLRIVCFSYVLTSITMIYLNSMRSIERVAISTLVYLISFVVNVVINAILIFGLLGFPKLGIQGAAIGTLAARLSEVMIVMIYNFRFNKIIKIRWKYIFKTPKWLVKDFIAFSMPVVLNELMWGLGTSANQAILGHLGSAVSAASSVAQVTRQLAMVVCFGIANATAIMIGKAIGEGNTALAEIYGKKFRNLSILMGLAGSAVVLCVRPVAMAVMSVSAESKAYMSVMLFVMAYFVIAQSYNTTLVVGIFRAGGDTKFGLYLDVSTMWFGSILLGFAAAYVLKLSLTWVYVLLLSDEIIKIPITTWRYNKKKWLKNITR